MEKNKMLNDWYFSSRLAMEKYSSFSRDEVVFDKCYFII